MRYSQIRLEAFGALALGVFLLPTSLGFIVGIGAVWMSVTLGVELEPNVALLAVLPYAGMLSSLMLAVTAVVSGCLTFLGIFGNNAYERWQRRRGRDRWMLNPRERQEKVRQILPVLQGTGGVFLLIGWVLYPSIYGALVERMMSITLPPDFTFCTVLGWCG